MSDDEENPTPPPTLMPPPPLPAPDGLPAPPPLPPMGDLPPPPMPGMPAPPPMPEMPAPPPVPELTAPPPMPEMPAPPPMPEMPAPPPMPEMPAPPPMPEMPAPPPMPEMPAPPPMPEISVPVSASSESPDEYVELPDPLAALDILTSTPAATESVEPMTTEQSPVPDLLTALDSTPNEDESPDSELSVADYKWKDTVLEAIIDKFEITDRDAFLVHATAFDANKNLYLTKKELTEAAKEWVELTTPIAELPSLPDPEVVSLDITPEPEQIEATDEDPVIEEPPVLTPPPIAHSTPETPPLPDVQPPLPAPPVMDLPPLPAPSPEATVEIQGSTDVHASDDESSNDQTEDYRELWKRRSDKSLPQMYGAIDRIGSGEVGSLLDRYSDRFGHELDREIIVMRRAEQDARREAVPVVELISAPEESEEEDELKIQLSEVEDILRPLQNAYKDTEEKSEKKRLAPALKALIAERKILLSVISGESDDDLLDDIPDRPEIPDYGQYDEDDEDDIEVSESTDEFVDFFNIINQLLGEMPEDWVNNFVASKGFALFQKIGTDPESADEKSRKKFFKMINIELESMPEDMLDAFVASPEFDLYKAMGELYGA